MVNRAAPNSHGLLARWASFAVRRRWRVLGAWVLLIVLLGVTGVAAGGDFTDNFSLPGTESQRATDLLEERFPSQAGDSATMVFQAPAGINDPTVRQQIDGVLAEAATLPEVSGVVSPYDNPAAISADGTIAYATIQYAKLTPDMNVEDLQLLVDLVERSSTDGLLVEAGGQVVQQVEQPEFGGTEFIGVGAAMIILLIAFGSVVAMGLPIATALAGLFAGMLGIGIAAAVVDIGTFTPAFGAMIGLGVGIDYALFVVTRYREGLHSGFSVEESVVRSVDTAGRAVAFAGIVVIIALLGLYAIGIAFIAAIGLAAAIVVGFSILVALTLLPALLGFAGHKVDRLRIPGLHTVETPGQRTVWFRWSEQIQKRPWPWLVASAGVLVLLALPLLDLRLGFSDASNNPESWHTRRAYDLLTDGFGPGFNGPLLLVIEDQDGVDPAFLDQLAATLRQTEGVAAVEPAHINEAGDTAILQVLPTTSPQDKDTPDTVRNLRENVIPQVVADTGNTVYVGGLTAALIDIGDKITSRMPIFFVLVIGLSMILLAAVFRSVVIPIKAALMNLLSIGAAYGLLVAIFQWGWGKELFGVAKTGPIEVFLPMMLFAILFGLSMDYEVFLLSRIREDYVRTGDSRVAVAHGLSATARVIAAAAAIMVCVFLSFVLGEDRIIKEFGLGLASAIFIDATIVRLALVPATMELLGDWNWWLPRWLDRALPRLNIEGNVPHLPAPPARQPEPAGQPAD